MIKGERSEIRQHSIKKTEIFFLRENEEYNCFSMSERSTVRVFSYPLEVIPENDVIAKICKNHY